MMPDTKLQQRIWKQWTEIGFQGNDPRTDFRGMGVLGLDQLLYVLLTVQLNIMFAFVCKCYIQ